MIFCFIKIIVFEKTRLIVVLSNNSFKLKISVFLMNPLEDSDIGINLKGFMKILDMNIELEETFGWSFFGTEHYKYKLTTDKYDWFIFPINTKMGKLILNTKPSGSDYYSGRQYKGKFIIHLPKELGKQVGSKKYKLVYLSEKEEMAEGRLERKNYLKKFGFWVEDNSGLMKKIFKTEEIFS